jgi:type VII secretion protein EccE
MKAQHRLGLDLSWPRITSTFVLDVAVLALASHLPNARQNVAWWYGMVVAAVITAVAVFTYRGITIASAFARWLLDWSAPEISDSSHDSEATLSRGCTPPVDHLRRFGRDVVGVREYQGQLVAVIAVDEPADSHSGREQSQTVGALPVAAVAAGLRQFDVRLDSIDIVSVRTRHVSQTADPSDPQPEDDLPTGVQHATWLVLRMDPQHNTAAVAARDSVASTLAAAVERLAGDLNGRRCAARPLTGDEFAAVDTAVAAGLRPSSTRPGWRHLKYFDAYATSFWVSPRDITSETLDGLWRHDTEATVVTIRLVAAAAGEAEVSAWVRYHSGKPVGKDVETGLNRLIGRQLAAVQASLPAPVTHTPLVVPARVLLDDDQLEVQVGPPMVGPAPQAPDEPEESDDAVRPAAMASSL